MPEPGFPAGRPKDVRAVAAITAVVCAAWAWGQNPELVEARTAMAPQLSAARASGKFSAILTGERDTGSRVIPLYSTIALQIVDIGGKPTIQVEVMNYEDGKVTGRLVGDGAYFIAYDVASRSYTSTAYGSVDQPTQHPRHAAILFGTLRKQSRGPVTLLSRLASDIFERDPNDWIPFVPSEQITAEPDWIRVDAASPYPTRTDHIIDAGTWDEVRHQMWPSGRYEYWNVEIRTGTIFSDSSFVFVPPAGSRSRSGGD